MLEMVDIGKLNQLIASMTFRLSYVIIFYLLHYFLGLFIGFDSFLKEKSKEGKWKINWSKLIILGIPIFVVSLGMFGVQRLWINPFINTNSQFFRIYFGYILITSFYKELDINRINCLEL